MVAVTELQLRLLGVPGASLDGRPVALRRRTSLALLAYLALTGRRYTRSMLAGILAGDASEEQAQKRVGNTLTDLRAAVGEHLHVTREWVAFDRERPHWVDVAEFEAQVAACTNPLEAPAAATAALDLYQGEFLAGVSLCDAPEFDEWLTLQRERQRLLLAQALQAALKGYVQNGTAAAPPAAGIALARRLLELDPWNEDAHQALMALLARNGQRGAALSHYAVCRRVLADELGVDPSPETAALAARLRAAPLAAPHNLPARATGFVGRHEELALVAGRLADPACRLVTLVGLGGSGKTALAIEAARRFVAPESGLGEPLFPDGVFMVPLAEAALTATDTPEAPEAARAPAPDTAQHAAARVGVAIGRALECLPEKGPADLRAGHSGSGDGGAIDHLAAVAGRLRSRRVLLVVDGIDGLVTGAGALATLLQQTAGVKLVVTSRMRLRLPGETVYDVRGLAVPAGAADLERSDAGQLFLEEAARVRPEAPLGPTERAAAAEVCRLLDGHPLALLLAAGGLRGVTCADLAADLAAGRELPGPASTAHGLLAGQTSLRAVLDAAWTQLTDAERAVLRRLAAFRGPFSRDAAAGAGAESAHLLGLVDAGLLGRLEGGRYALNPLVQRYAAARQAEASAAAGAAAGTLPSSASAGDAPAGDPGTAAAAVPARLALGAALGEGLSRLGGALRLLAEALEGAPAPTLMPGTGRDAGRDWRRGARRAVRGRSSPPNVPEAPDVRVARPRCPRGRRSARSLRRSPGAGPELRGAPQTVPQAARRGQGRADARGPPRCRDPAPRPPAVPPPSGRRHTKETRSCFAVWACAAAERRGKAPPAHHKGGPRRGQPGSWEPASGCASAWWPSATTSTWRTPAASGCSGSTARPCGYATRCTSRTCRATSGTGSRRSWSASGSR
jgi:DNA-binding SARP family transcriptional activator